MSANDSRSTKAGRETGVGRRTFLGSAVTASLTLAGVGAVTGRVAAGGGKGDDDGGYAAPDDYPRISTRGHFDDDGNLTEKGTTYNYDGVGDWARYTEPQHDEVMIFVHGFTVGSEDDADIDQAYTAERAFERNGKDETMVCYTWDAGDNLVDWYTQVEIAKKNGPKLANWITNHNQAGGDPVRLVAHSLGAQVACSTILNLGAWGQTDAVEEAVLLGGAIPDQTVAMERTYGEAIEKATKTFSNYYKTDDQILDKLFGTAEFDTAVGEEGIQSDLTPPENYREYNVSYVPGHGGYFRPGDGCIAEVVEHFEESVDGDDDDSNE